MKLLNILLIFTLLTSAEIFSQDFSNYKFTINTLGTNINSANDDYAPVIIQDKKTLNFTSYDRPGSVGKADLFISDFKSGSWQNAINAGNDINTEGNDGAVSFAADGKTFVFSSDARSGSAIP